MGWPFSCSARLELRSLAAWTSFLSSEMLWLLCTPHRLPHSLAGIGLLLAAGWEEGQELGGSEPVCVPTLGHAVHPEPLKPAARDMWRFVTGIIVKLNPDYRRVWSVPGSRLSPAGSCLAPRGDRAGTWVCVGWGCGDFLRLAWCRAGRAWQRPAALFRRALREKGAWFGLSCFPQQESFQPVSTGAAQY